MFDESQKSVALDFARLLSKRDYLAACDLCSMQLKSRLTVDSLQMEFENIIPLDWGLIDPIEIEDSMDFPVVYITLGGDVYSEAILVSSFVVEDGEPRIDSVQFGRP